MYRQWGGTVINMSVLPEAKLAKEAEIAYQMICMSTDYDCWHATEEDVTVELVMQNMTANAANARRFVVAVLDELIKEENKGVIEAKHLADMTMRGMSTSHGHTAKQITKKIDWLFKPAS